MRVGRKATYKKAIKKIELEHVNKEPQQMIKMTYLHKIHLKMNTWD